MTAEPTALELGGVGRGRWRPTRLQTCVTLWLALVGLLLWRWHLTTNRGQLFVIIGTGLIATGAARLDHIGRVVRDWLPLFLILFAYDSLRNQADKWFAVHVTPQINADKFLFGGVVPTVWLQHAMFTPGRPHWWDYVAFVVYLSHFFAALIVAAVLWKFAYPQFKRFAFLFVTLSFAGFVTYALYPAAPPWLASQSHALAPTAKIVDEIWAHLGLKPVVGAGKFRQPGRGGAVTARRVPCAAPVVLLEEGGTLALAAGPLCARDGLQPRVCR